MPNIGKMEAREIEELFINVSPTQAGGRLTPEAQKAVLAYSDGYSVCDNCVRPFRLDYIKKPALADFHVECAEWLNMAAVRVVPGARRGFQAIANSLVEKGDPVILSSLGHYTEYVSIEQAGGIPCEIPKDAKNHITAENTAAKIEEVIDKYKKTPPLMYIDHVDYQFGNLHDIAGIAKAAHAHDVPVLLNGAYTVGTMPIDGKKLGVDFIVGSGHKSMAAPAPSGIVAANEEYAEKVFSTTKVAGDVTGRKFGIKEVQIIGCSLMGVTMAGLVASFPTVKKRVENWDTEVKHSQIIADALTDIDGTVILSDNPREHTLTRVDTKDSFDKVAETHKKKGYYFAAALRKRGICGIIPGTTRVWKYNVFGLTDRQTNYLAESFKAVAEENGLPVSN